VTTRVEVFLAKSWSERYRVAEFYLRQGLAKLPYLPIPVQLRISAEQAAEFWWSRLAPYYDAGRGFLDYWGDDASDLRFLWRTLQPGMTFFDIGANEGVYSVVAAAKLAGAGSVVAFEPCPRHYNRLRLNWRWDWASNARTERWRLAPQPAVQYF
jgi:hypothetical protein